MSGRGSQRKNRGEPGLMAIMRQQEKNASNTGSDVPIPVSIEEQESWSRGMQRDRSNARDTSEPSANKPLAIRMRPSTLDDVIGQDEALAPGSPLRRIAVPVDQSMSVAPSAIILYGPPGVGKTTLAKIVARQSGRIMVELSATDSSVKDVKNAIIQARSTWATYHRETILFIDEIHRFSKSQQDALLPGVENRDITFIAATTENPSYSVIPPLLSRSVIVRLRSLTDDDLIEVIRRAVASPRGLDNRLRLTSDAEKTLAMLGGGDARKTLGILEAAVSAHDLKTPVLPAADDIANNAGNNDTNAGDSIDASIGDSVLTEDDIETVMKSADASYDRGGDDHYDLASAFIKSMRGSNPDAALLYAARMLEGGEDPRFIARRVVIAASEDVGLADPSVLQTCVAAARAIEMIGMPEARIPLSEAIVAVATAPKSNASYLAMDAALEDARNHVGGPVPLYLRNATDSEKRQEGYGNGYKYAHDWPHAVSPQEYMPDDMSGTVYYHPNQRGHEVDITRRMQRVNKILGRVDSIASAGAYETEDKTVDENVDETVDNAHYDSTREDKNEDKSVGNAPHDAHHDSTHELKNEDENESKSEDKNESNAHTVFIPGSDASISEDDLL